MTEEEAKTKWCPMASNRSVSAKCADGSLDVARFDSKNSKIGLSTACIASDCMMWVPERRNIEGTLTIVNGGYCGLAK